MNFHQTIASKIVSLDQLTEEIGRLRTTDRPPVVVFTNGCFDLVHQGHVDYLSRARDLGDLLIVGLNTDASVSDIAATAGYDDANYFVKVYKKEFGETPSETRAKRT